MHWIKFKAILFKRSHNTASQNGLNHDRWLHTKEKLKKGSFEGLTWEGVSAWLAVFGTARIKNVGSVDKMLYLEPNPLPGVI